VAVWRHEGTPALLRNLSHDVPSPLFSSNRHGIVRFNLHSDPDPTRAAPNFLSVSTTI